MAGRVTSDLGPKRSEIGMYQCPFVGRCRMATQLFPALWRDSVGQFHGVRPDIHDARFELESGPQQVRPHPPFSMELDGRAAPNEVGVSAATAMPSMMSRRPQDAEVFDA